MKKHKKFLKTHTLLKILMSIFCAAALWLLYNFDIFQRPLFSLRYTWQAPVSAHTTEDGGLLVLDNPEGILVHINKNGTFKKSTRLIKNNTYSQAENAVAGDGTTIYMYGTSRYQGSVIPKSIAITEPAHKIRQADRTVFAETFQENSGADLRDFSILSAIRFEDGILKFSKLERGDVRLFMYDTKKKELLESRVNGFTGASAILNLCLKDFANYAFTTRTGEIYQVAGGGVPRLLAALGGEMPGGIIPFSVDYGADGSVLFSDQQSGCIYALSSRLGGVEDGGFAAEGVILREAVPRRSFDTLRSDGAAPPAADFSVRGGVISGVYGGVPWIYDGETFTAFTGSIPFSFAEAARTISVYFAVLIGIIALGMFLHYYIVYIKRGYVSLYIRYVLLLVPFAFGIFLLLYTIMYKSIGKRIEAAMFKELQAFSAAAAASFTPEEHAYMDAVHSLGDYGGDAYTALNTKIKKIVNNNTDAWNTNYLVSLYKFFPEKPDSQTEAGAVTDSQTEAGGAVTGSTADGAGQRLVFIAASNDAHNLFYPAAVFTGSHYGLLAAGKPVFGTRTTAAGTWAFAGSLLYTAEGAPAGVLETAVDVQEINIKNKHDNMIVYESIAVSIFALMLIMVLSFTNVTIHIQKIIAAINEIKNGNYKARVCCSDNNEVGDLCNNFNYLAAVLESKLGVEAVAKAEKAFTAMLSHEIRTPLNAILGLAEIELQNPALSDEIKININKIYTSGYGLLTIINDFLDITKMESGRFDIIDSEYNVADLINSAIEINKVRIKNKPIVFEVVIDPELPAFLFGDDTRLRQILNNLLSNAFKYTEKGSVVLTVTWKKKQIRVSKFFGVEAETPPDFNNEGIMEICVQDTGIGIQKGNLQKIFDKYAQVDLKKNKKIEGTGLGLTITKQLVELMGGTIHIDSEYGAGSTFTVNVPQGICGETMIGKETADKLAAFLYVAQIGADRNKIKRIPMPYARILVVDDVETNLDVAKGMLKPYGITVDCVSSGYEALERVKKADSGEIPYYNAIFIDHLMSGLDGLETTKCIRTESGSVYTKTVPIIVMTGNSRDEYTGLFSGSGLTDYLSKPIDINALNDILNIYVCRGDEYTGETSQSVPKTYGAPAAGVERTGAVYSEGQAAGAASMDEYSGDAEWLEGIDLEKGIERFGSLEAYLEIAASFIKSSRTLLSSLSAIEHTINGENVDFDTFMINSHGIKGAARGVFAVDIGNEAEKIEVKSREHDADYLRQHARAFVEKTYKTLENLQKIIDTNTVAAKKQHIEHIPPKLLEKLGAACQELDIEKLDDITEELKKYEYISEDDKELAEWLIERIENSDFGDIIRRLPPAEH